MTETDPIMARITEAITVLQKGNKARARDLFGQIWKEVNEAGDYFHACTLAHFMADAQDDTSEELAWDLRALEAANALNDDRVKKHHASMSLRSFYPSLHLNLAEDYRKLRDGDAARKHLKSAQDHMDAIPDTELGSMIRGGINRLADRLDKGDFSS